MFRLVQIDASGQRFPTSADFSQDLEYQHEWSFDLFISHLEGHLGSICPNTRSLFYSVRCGSFLWWRHWFFSVAQFAAAPAAQVTDTFPFRVPKDQTDRAVQSFVGDQLRIHECSLLDKRKSKRNLWMVEHFISFHQQWNISDFPKDTFWFCRQANEPSHSSSVDAVEMGPLNYLSASFLIALRNFFITPYYYWRILGALY